MEIAHIEIRFEVASASAIQFAIKHGRPVPATAESDALWAARKVPTGPLRRQAAEYLWAGPCAGICTLCESPIDLQFRGNHPGAPTVDRIIPGDAGGDYVWGNVSLPVSAKWARDLLNAKLRGVAGEQTRSDILRVQIAHAARRLVEVRADLAGAGLTAEATEDRLRWLALHQEHVELWPAVADLWERQTRRG
jgi:hypothetical protein